MHWIPTVVTLCQIEMNPKIIFFSVNLWLEHSTGGWFWCWCVWIYHLDFLSMSGLLVIGGDGRLDLDPLRVCLRVDKNKKCDIFVTDGVKAGDVTQDMRNVKVDIAVITWGLTSHLSWHPDTGRHIARGISPGARVMFVHFNPRLEPGNNLSSSLCEDTGMESVSEE